MVGTSFPLFVLGEAREEHEYLSTVYVEQSEIQHTNPCIQRRATACYVSSCILLFCIMKEICAKDGGCEVTVDFDINLINHVWYSTNKHGQSANEKKKSLLT